MNYPTDHQQKVAAAQSTNAHLQGAIGINAGHVGAQSVAGSDVPPVEYSVRRLFERLNQLHTEAEMLSDRLGPVSRSEKIAGDGCAEARAPSECQLVEVLDQAAERVELVINRLSGARGRLCI